MTNTPVYEATGKNVERGLLERVEGAARQMKVRPTGLHESLVQDLAPALWELVEAGEEVRHVLAALTRGRTAASPQDYDTFEVNADWFPEAKRVCKRLRAALAPFLPSGGSGSRDEEDA